MPFQASAFSRAMTRGFRASGQLVQRRPSLHEETGDFARTRNRWCLRCRRMSLRRREFRSAPPSCGRRLDHRLGADHHRRAGAVTQATSRYFPSPDMQDRIRISSSSSSGFTCHSSAADAHDVDVVGCRILRLHRPDDMIEDRLAGELVAEILSPEQKPGCKSQACRTSRWPPCRRRQCHRRSSRVRRSDRRRWPAGIGVFSIISFDRFEQPLLATENNVG